MLPNTLPYTRVCGAVLCCAEWPGVTINQGRKKVGPRKKDRSQFGKKISPSYYYPLISSISPYPPLYYPLISSMKISPHQQNNPLISKSSSYYPLSEALTTQILICLLDRSIILILIKWRWVSDSASRQLVCRSPNPTTLKTLLPRPLAAVPYFATTYLVQLTPLYHTLELLGITHTALPYSGRTL